MKIRSLSQRVLEWWDKHRRVLPWRAAAGKAPDPYAVWLSEILLQQTTVATATPYFEKFIRTWPQVDNLAQASLDEVMRAFAGLGYYTRARNLHACAREIARRGGIFPDAEVELRTLPGIGAYTAAAIAAIAFGQPTTPVDGNIARIVARLIALETPISASRAQINKAAGSPQNNADSPRASLPSERSSCGLENASGMEKFQMANFKWRTKTGVEKFIRN